MIEYEYYDWNNLIGVDAKQRMVADIDTVIDRGDYWKNSPPYQTNINIFGLNTEDWINLKMSFIWSCFAYMKQEKSIKGIKSWGYKTNVDTQEDRNTYWHQHNRPNVITLSGVFYIKIPKGAKSKTSGTELAHDNPEGKTTYVPAKEGHWLIFPGKTWHRPGILEKKQWRYIVAADMEI